MANANDSLRFDHRELAVIFSLFTFVSLLMFTVGILVGKGLAQAKYEAALLKSSARNLHALPPPAEDHAPAAVLPPAHEEHAAAAAPAHAAEPEEKVIAATDDADDKPAASAPGHAAAAAAAPHDLKLVPKTDKGTEALTADIPDSLKPEDTDHVLKNPKIRDLVEDAPSSPKESFASLVPLPKRPTGPLGKASGKFTVQVGSYLSQRDAADRVEQLKKLGFPYAYFSAKELGEQKETWFRVWLGYFPDMESANASGKQLQSRGEVRNYLVRKSDSSH